MNTLVTDRRLRHRVGHLEEVLHRLVHLAEIKQEHEQRTGRHLVRHHEIHAIPQHEACSDRDDHFDYGGEFRFQAARPERHLDALETLPGETFFFVVFTREGLAHADRPQHFSNDRNYFAFFFAQRTRRLLDAMCVGVDDDKEEWG